MKVDPSLLLFFDGDIEAHDLVLPNSHIITNNSESSAELEDDNTSEGSEMDVTVIEHNLDKSNADQEITLSSSSSDSSEFLGFNTEPLQSPNDSTTSDFLGFNTEPLPSPIHSVASDSQRSNNESSPSCSKTATNIGGAKETAIKMSPQTVNKLRHLGRGVPIRKDPNFVYDKPRKAAHLSK